jgi:hypothetical protein
VVFPTEVDLRSTHTTPFTATKEHETRIQVETIYLALHLYV